MEPLTMMVAGIGLQFLNNYANNKKNKEIQEKQREFQRAAAEHDFERMRRLQAESAKLALELEAEVHKERVEDINNNYDTLLENFAHSFTIQNWPLSVLPFVMKGESFGSLFNGTTQSVNLHCILTPSNCEWFNANFYDDIDLRLEAEMNSKWNAQSTHPIVYYGGAWNRRKDAKTGISVPKNIDLVDIDLIKTSLKNVPVVVITPYFDPWLHFKVKMWGMGEDAGAPFRIDIPHGEEVNGSYQEPAQRIFSFDYHKDKYELTAGFENKTVEEFVPYIEYLIGFIADKYFWSMYRIPPRLPEIASKDEFLNTNLRLVEMYKTESENLCFQITECQLYNNYSPEIYLQYLVRLHPILGDENCYRLLMKFLEGWAHKVGISVEGKSTTAELVNSLWPNDTKCAIKFISFLNKIQSYKEARPMTKDQFFIDTNQYECKRNELLAIIDGLIAVDGISKDRIEEFKRIRKKCLENQFNIVLIGEFQGGKSTTFNAFCGGREISPRGAMIKTSACAITASNLSDEKEEEFALIQWKTDAELLLNIRSVLNKYISKDDVNFNEVDNETFEPYKYLQLSNEKHIALIKEALDKEYKSISSARITNNDALDIIKIAEIVVKFYNHPKIVALRHQNIVEVGGTCRTKCTIEEVSDFAVFPECWEEKTAEGTFEAQDVVFAFIAGIECYIHSKNLERLGCSITDCPGLFTSSWDTQVALSTIPRADAVIYLLGGNKQMTDGDKKAISYIKTIESINDKLFFVINTRQGDKVTQNIINTNQTILRSLGFEDAKIHLLNSQLFFLGEFGTSYVNHRLDAYSLSRFKIVSSKFDIGEEELETCWAKVAEDALYAIKKHREIDVVGLDEQTSESLLATSNYHSVFNEIESFVIRKKAFSILVQCGANLVLNSLGEIECGLKQQENDALRDVASCEAQFQEAQTALLNFQKEAKDLIENAISDDDINRVASRAYNDIIRNQSNLVRLSVKASQAMVPVIGVKCKMYAAEIKVCELALRTRLFSEQIQQRLEALRGKMQLIIEPVIKTVLEEELSSKISIWVANVISGNDCNYNAVIQPRLEALSEKLSEKWEKCIRKHESIKSFKIQLPPDRLDELIKISKGIEINGQDVVNASTEIIMQSLTKSIITNVVAVVVGTVMFLIMDWCLGAGFGTIIGVAYYILTRIGLAQKEESNPNASCKDELLKSEQKIYDSIYLLLNTKFNEVETLHTLEDGLKYLPCEAVKRYKDFYYQQLEKQKNDLLINIEERRRNKQGSVENQQQIAKKCYDLRKNKIAPMLQRITEFLQSCRINKQ